MDNKLHIIAEVRSLVNLGLCGGPFVDYAARSILMAIRLKRELVDNSALSCILASALRRHDADAALRFAIDWSDPCSLPTADITRFNPGSHYHVLDAKFDTHGEAVVHLLRNGYRQGRSYTINVCCEGD